MKSNDQEVECIAQVSWATRDVIDEADRRGITLSASQANRILDRCASKLERAQVTAGFEVIAEAILRAHR